MLNMFKGFINNKKESAKLIERSRLILSKSFDHYAKLSGIEEMDSYAIAVSIVESKGKSSASSPVILMINSLATYLSMKLISGEYTDNITKGAFEIFHNNLRGIFSDHDMYKSLGIRDQMLLGDCAIYYKKIGHYEDVNEMVVIIKECLNHK